MVETISTPKPVDIFLDRIERRARGVEWDGEERKKEGWYGHEHNLTLELRPSFAATRKPPDPEMLPLWEI
jgi:hypothetical protein